MFNKLINRLPDNYNKSPDSNVGKLYKIFTKELEEVKKAFEDIKEYQNMDLALGKTLDSIGKNVLEYRNTADDGLYRKLVKIKIVANRSDGDIETMNTILETYMEEDFLFIEDGWKSLFAEPASIVLNVSRNTNRIPFKVMNRIKAAGVRVYYAAGAEPTNIIVELKSYVFNVPYKICNMFRTDDVKGGLMKVGFDILEKSYAFDVSYPICNTFVTSQIVVENQSINVVLTEEYRDNEVLFKRVGNTTVGEGDI